MPGTPQTVGLSHFDDTHPLMQVGFRVAAPPVSASSLGAYYRCHRYFLWRYRLGLTPEGFDEAWSATEGKWFHAVLRGLVSGESLDVVKKQVQVQLHQAIDAAGDAQGVTPAGTVERLERHYQKAVAMGRAFIEIARTGGFRFVDPARTVILGAEKEITAELPGTGFWKNRNIRLAGTLDLITQDKVTGEITIHDYKRVSGSPQQRAKTALIEPQPWVYRLLAQAAGWTPMWFVHWIMKSPTIRQRKKKQPETFTEYLARAGEWYIDQAKANTDDPPLVRSTLRLGGPPLTTQRVRQLREVSIASSRRATAETFPETGAASSGCMAYGRLCPYIDLCTSDPALWVDGILNNFRQEFRYESDESG